jgi:molecular chaperone GrpE
MTTTPETEIKEPMAAESLVLEPELQLPEQPEQAGAGTETPEPHTEQGTETLHHPAPEAAAEPEPSEPDWRERYIRMAAEYDNYRKRTLREKEELGQHTRAQMLRTLVPLLLDFGRAIDAAHKSENLEALRDGLSSLDRKLTGSYQKLAFNAEVHEAVMGRPATEGETSGTVVEVLTKGYRYRGQLIQEAKVIVAE